MGATKGQLGFGDGLATSSRRLDRALALRLRRSQSGPSGSCTSKPSACLPAGVNPSALQSVAASIPIFRNGVSAGCTTTSCPITSPREFCIGRRETGPSAASTARKLDASSSNRHSLSTLSRSAPRICGSDQTHPHTASPAAPRSPGGSGVTLDASTPVRRPFSGRSAAFRTPLPQKQILWVRKN